MRLLSPVFDVRALVRVICNLSGLGRFLCDPLLTRRTAQRVTLSASNGESLCVNVDGSGPPVVLVHGLWGAADTPGTPLRSAWRLVTGS